MFFFFCASSLENGPDNIGNAKTEGTEIHAGTEAAASGVGTIAAYGIEGMQGCGQNIGKDNDLDEVIFATEVKEHADKPADAGHAQQRKEKTTFQAGSFPASAFGNNREQVKLSQCREQSAAQKPDEQNKKKGHQLTACISRKAWEKRRLPACGQAKTYAMSFFQSSTEIFKERASSHF